MRSLSSPVGPYLETSNHRQQLKYLIIDFAQLKDIHLEAAAKYSTN